MHSSSGKAAVSEVMDLACHEEQLVACEDLRAAVLSCALNYLQMEHLQFWARKGQGLFI